MNKFPCRCHFIPDVVFSEINKTGEHVEPSTYVNIDKKIRTNRQSLMSLIPEIGNNERLIYDCKNTSNLQVNLVRQENDAPIADSDANTVYDNIGLVRNYYKTVLGWDSIDNNALDLVSSVHFNVRYNNAFWDGKQMIFGDGDGTNFQNFARALDVTAHELTHGVVQYTANLEYKGQSGALNEHFADVFGTAIKQYYLRQNQYSANWLIGELCLTGRFQGKAIRSMKAPADANVVMMAQPDNMKNIYSGTGDNSGVHVNSGIPNYAFYLTAMGIGTQNAAILWFEALKILTPAAKFNDLYNALSRATRMLMSNRRIPASAQVNLNAAFRWVGII